MTYGEIRDYVRGLFAGLVRFTKTSGATSDGQGDQTEGRGEEDEAPPYPVRRLWPFGIRSMPPDGVDAVVVHANGSSTSGIMVGAESADYGPSDLEGGELALYSQFNPEVALADKDGKTTITSTDAADPPVVKSKLEMNADGSVTWTSVVDDASKSVVFSFDADGKLTATTPSGQDINLNAGRDVAISAGRDATVTTTRDAVVTATGKITATGTTINLNGNAKGVAREGHKVGDGELSITHTPASGGPPLTTACSLSIIYVPGDGSANQTLTDSGVIHIHEKIVEGSASVLIKAD